MLGRRELIAMLGGAAAWPLAARAQQAAMPVIGLLGSTTAQGYATQLAAFRRGLNEIGFAEGRNVGIEYRWAENQYDRLPALAADLTRRQVAVIATIGGASVLAAAKAATATIPIVFHSSLDPVKAGFVASLNRPGGNVTGVTSSNTALVPKRLELLHEMVPAARILALLVNPTNRNAVEGQAITQAAAERLGLRLQVLPASNERDFEVDFSRLAQLRLGGLVIASDAFFVSQSKRLAGLTVLHALPAIFQYRAFVESGGLMSYGDSPTDSYRLCGVYTGRILKGEKPADLAVQQATKTELFINFKAAKALGLTIPTALLVRADEVIE